MSDIFVSNEYDRATVVKQAMAQLVSEEVSGFVNELETEYIGKVSTLSLGLCAELSADGNVVDVDYETETGYTDTMDAFVPKSVSEIENIGVDQAKEVIGLSGERLASGLVTTYGNSSFTYKRVEARDYANYYTSNPAARYCIWHKQNIMQDPKQYNTGSYDWLCCKDCANYVSQAMRRGGVPTDGTWKKGSAAWQSCGGMLRYFKNTKGWWETSNFSRCNAGGIIFLYNTSTSGEPDHVMMNVQNDSVTRAYSAHSNDRQKKVYTSNAAFGGGTVHYYRFTNVYPVH